jgi:hypothetical protein
MTGQERLDFLSFDQYGDFTIALDTITEDSVPSKQLFGLQSGAGPPAGES